MRDEVNTFKIYNLLDYEDAQKYWQLQNKFNADMGRRSGNNEMNTLLQKCIAECVLSQIS